MLLVPGTKPGIPGFVPGTKSGVLRYICRVLQTSRSAHYRLHRAKTPPSVRRLLPSHEQRRAHKAVSASD